MTDAEIAAAAQALREGDLRRRLAAVETERDAARKALLEIGVTADNEIASLKAALAAAREERDEARNRMKEDQRWTEEASLAVRGLRATDPDVFTGHPVVDCIAGVKAAIAVERTSNKGLREELRDMHHQCAVIEEEHAAERTSAEALRKALREILPLHDAGTAVLIAQRALALPYEAEGRPKEDLEALRAASVESAPGRCNHPVDRRACDRPAGHDGDHANTSGPMPRHTPEELRKLLDGAVPGGVEMGECYAHLGPPNNTGTPHPKGGTCYGWKPLAPASVHPAAAPQGRCCSSSHEPPDTACRNFLAGANGRCVYCEHEEKCHPGPGATCEIGSGESAPRQEQGAAARIREALEDVLDLLGKAGLLNLSNGVQLGPTAWYVKMSDAVDFARRQLASEQPRAALSEKEK